MLFRASSILLLVLSLNFLWGIRPLDYTLAALIAVWLAVSIRGMTSMRSQVFGRVYWRGEHPLKVVALSFDDGPTEPSTPQVLDVLNGHGIKATFFVIGDNLKRHPDIARRIHMEGHEMGNHTMSHPWVFKMLFKSIRDDILRCQDEILKATGARPVIFRQPVGINNPSVMKVIDGLGMVMVGWQARAYDASGAKKEDIVKRIIGRTRPGGIILLHDGHDGRSVPDRDATVEALKEIIPALKERGYEFKTVSELLNLKTNC